MKYELVFSRKFRKRISKLNKKEQIVILKKIKTLRDNPSTGKPLKSGAKKLRSLRVGKYRVIYKINREIYILAVGHRRDIYRFTFSAHDF
jgi:mRNA interferase RelE/StbE